MTEEEKKKLDMTQKAMIFVSVAGGAVGLVLGGALGYKTGNFKGFLKGIDCVKDSFISCVENGFLKVTDATTGEVITPEQLKNITFF